MSVRSEVFLLGTAPKPATSAELSASVTSALQQLIAERAACDVVIEGRDRLQVATTCDGDDVSIDISLTGMSVTVAGAPSFTTSSLLASGTIARRTPGIVRRGTLIAQPLLVSGAPVHLAAEVRELPFDWAELDDGRLGLVEPDTRTGEQVAGFCLLDISLAAVQEIAESTLRAVLDDMGLKLGELDLKLASDGPRACSIEATANIRKGFLSATATLRGSARVTDGMVVHLEDIELSSKNPVVGLALAAAKGTIERIASKPIDIASQLPLGIKLSNVELTIDDAVQLRADIG